MSFGELVSCLCVTRDRVALLRRAVDCFRRQTYENRELLVLFEDDDAATRDFMADIADPRIRTLEVPSQPKRSLGSLRNHSIASARGELIAQWDDDDWYAPQRLETQIRAIDQSGRPACVLAQWLIFDAVERKAYLSVQRAWEGSLVAIKHSLPVYADLPRGEDTPAIDSIIKSGNLISLKCPEMYVYINHGSNTWDRAHFEKNILAYSTPLPAEQTKKIMDLVMSGAG